MNGNAFLLDTNTIIALLRGESGIQESIVSAIWLYPGYTCYYRGKINSRQNFT
jgi:predicted nucleic acid-binding protein